MQALPVLSGPASPLVLFLSPLNLCWLALVVVVVGSSWGAAAQYSSHPPDSSEAAVRPVNINKIANNKTACQVRSPVSLSYSVVSCENTFISTLLLYPGLI